MSQRNLIASHEVLRIAIEDAVTKYRDLTDLRVEIDIHEDGWHVAFEPGDPDTHGGGPHYIINPVDGTIVWKKYYQ